MSEPIVRYPLDPTGTNPNNLVVGELHTLSTRPNRAAATNYGAYFSFNVQVYDNINNRLLVKGVDYKCCELMQEPTLLFGKEICLLILIINSEVGSVIRINYQTLGGHYQNSAGEIINLYETVMNDNRAVDWLNIINKPYEYPPNLHNHLLGDIYGFEPVVFALERIRNALLLSDIPAFEALIDWLKAQLVNLKAHLLDYNNPHQTNKEQLGLGNIESDVSYISSMINAHTTDTENPHNVTKAQIGLGNADNTADINKPLSNATLNALNALNSSIQDLLNIMNIEIKENEANILFNNSMINAHITDTENPHNNIRYKTFSLPISDLEGSDTIYLSHNLNTNFLQISVILEKNNLADYTRILPSYTPSSAQPGCHDVVLMSEIVYTDKNTIRIQFLTDYPQTTGTAGSKLAVYKNILVFITASPY